MSEAQPQINPFQRDWSAYYQAVEGRGPRDTLLATLAYFEAETTWINPRFAVDLGCGEGRDTIELLNRGWQVLSIDGEEEAIERLRRRVEGVNERLETLVASFEAVNLPENIDLVNASFSLPFCPPASFPHLWQQIVNGLKIGGRFCGQLFGERDSWAKAGTVHYHTLNQVEALLRPFDIELLQEEERVGQTALGEEKHWHIFNLIVRKKDESVS